MGAFQTFHFQPGELTPEAANALNALGEEVRRLANLQGVAPLRKEEGAGGPLLIVDGLDDLREATGLALTTSIITSRDGTEPGTGTAQPKKLNDATPRVLVSDGDPIDVYSLFEYEIPSGEYIHLIKDPKSTDGALFAIPTKFPFECHKLVEDIVCCPPLTKRQADYKFPIEEAFFPGAACNEPAYPDPC